MVFKSCGQETKMYTGKSDSAQVNRNCIFLSPKFLFYKSALDKIHILMKKVTSMYYSEINKQLLHNILMKFSQMLF